MENSSTKHKAVHPDFLLFDRHTPTSASKCRLSLPQQIAFRQTNQSPNSLSNFPGLHLPHLLASERWLGTHFDWVGESPQPGANGGKMYKLPAQHGKLRIATLSLSTLAERKPRAEGLATFFSTCISGDLFGQVGCTLETKCISLPERQKKKLGIGPLRLLNAFSGLIFLTVLRFRLWASFWF